ncbi:Transmembrane domain-containing protein [Orpheovirus IHUMI-LCC2]|uniref:Transmembrane domain-containing protein n=1 Tax=Orpheovirus IHUMI-LCC2 TaxID=2023057 RepID=A0A2I2L474_9VIRU|nr:Transmembrane domain-containing protein [Orpheovirus IHUMI-LCC2]SNW62355.1 Transmembrane domain-containing protein [Orpheovirus IHUMI-LCC2]
MKIKLNVAFDKMLSRVLNLSTKANNKSTLFNSCFLLGKKNYSTISNLFTPSVHNDVTGQSNLESRSHFLNKLRSKSKETASLIYEHERKLGNAYLNGQSDEVTKNLKLELENYINTKNIYDTSIYRYAEKFEQDFDAYDKKNGYENVDVKIHIGGFVGISAALTALSGMVSNTITLGMFESCLSIIAMSMVYVGTQEFSKMNREEKFMKMPYDE